jgi:hypothetical protein
VKCGDVIIAQPGTYSGSWSVFGTNEWGPVSGCPSTSGGIDGRGGIYFAVVLCGGSLGTCTITHDNDVDVRIDASNWAVEGFYMTQTGGGSIGGTGCASATSESNTTQHHVAFINDIAVNCNFGGFGTYSWTSPGGVDQTAVVGTITYNDALSLNSGGSCTSGISLIPVNGPDKSAGTHIFVAGNFGYKNTNAPSGAGCNTDGQAVIFDSWSCTKYSHLGVVEQNVWWMNGSSGFEAFPNCVSNGDKAQIYLSNNTSYANERDPLHNGNYDLFLNQVLPTTTTGGYYKFYNNIFAPTLITSGNNNGYPVVAAGISINNNNTSLIVASGNYIWQSNPGTKTSAGAPNTDVWVKGTENATSFPFGTNTYGDPGFANPSGLPTTPPNCANYNDTTDCMNGRYNIAADLKPSGGAAVKGYQAPGACAPDANYPTWLKGVVYLHWTGSSLTENSGLITKPCNM